MSVKRIVIAPDSFKECLTSPEVARAIETGLRRVWADAEIECVPMADGGEGTVEALITATGGRYLTANVRDPLGNLIEAKYGILGDGKTAVIETAAASGLALIPTKDRHPGFTTTFGTGQLMREAIEQGVETVIVGLGGSGTNDAGAGMAQALGYALRDADDAELPFGGFALARLDWIDNSKRHAGLDNVEVIAAYDVDNPLCGPTGTSRIYGPQKGASAKTVEMLDAALEHFSRYVEEEFDLNVSELPGAGAAGGFGAGLVVFANAKLRPGFDVVSQACGLADRMEQADLVITGEGKMDAQSAYGKTPVAVARMAGERGVPTVAFVGSLGDDAEGACGHHFERIIPIAAEGRTVEHAIEHAPELLADATETFARNYTPDSAAH